MKGKFGMFISGPTTSPQNQPLIVFFCIMTDNFSENGPTGAENEIGQNSILMETKRG